MPEPLAREDFEPLIDAELPMQIGATPVQARLVEVRALQSPSPRPTPPFVLTFLVRGDISAAQGTHCLTHPTLGAIEMFMVPVGRDATGTRFEAVFN